MEESSEKERIIPITILSSKHHSDENDNKRHSVPSLGAKINDIHEDLTSKRKSLVVTLEDGTVTETQATILGVKNHENNNSSPSPLSIQVRFIFGNIF